MGCCLQTKYLSRPAPPQVKASKGQKHYRGSSVNTEESPYRGQGILSLQFPGWSKITVNLLCLKRCHDRLISTTVQVKPVHGSVYIFTEGFPANTHCQNFQPYHTNHFGHLDQVDLPNHQGLKECFEFVCQGNFAHLFDHHYFHCLCSSIPASLYI